MQISIAAVAVSAVATSALAQLTPPAGPVTDTGRFGNRTELSQATAPGTGDALFRITSPGSYVLTGNVAARAGESGIEVAADGVTLDLNGYTIAADPSGGLAGITIPEPNTIADTPVRRLHISNGSIVGFETGVELRRSRPSGGIAFFTRNVIDGLIEDLSVDSVKGIDAPNSTVRDVVVTATTLGIATQNGAISNARVSVTPIDSRNATGISVIDSVVTGASVQGGSPAFEITGVLASDSALESVAVSISSPDASGARIQSSTIRGSVIDTGFLAGDTGMSMSGGSLASNCVVKNATTAFRNLDASLQLVESCTVFNISTPFFGSFVSRDNAGF